MLRFAAMISLLAIAACEDPDPCNSRKAAYSAATKHIKTLLKSPSTADFPQLGSEGVTATPYGECNFIIVGFVDAQNSFGATIRQTYSLEIKHANGDWSASGVVFN